MKDKKILYISSEVVPYLPHSELSNLAFEIPKMVNDRGGQTRIFIPKYGLINERRHQLHEVIRLSGMNLVVNDIDMPLIIKVASIPKERMQVYFIDNEDYFKRKATYADENGNFFSDNDERAIFFAKGVIETVKKLEQRGIAGVCFEDKLFPKTNSFIDGESQKLADIGEFSSTR